MSRPQRFRLGDLLVQDKLITDENLNEALAEQRTSGRKLGQVLIDHGWITEAQIAKIGRASCRERVSSPV